MRYLLTTLSIIFLFLSLPHHSNATVFTAIKDGDWHETTTWDQAALPSSGDTVIIDGFSVEFNNLAGNVTILRLEITNASGVDKSELLIKQDSTLTVLNNLEVIANNIDKDILLKIQDNANLNVNGNVLYERVVGNTTSSKLMLNLIGNASMDVVGTFTYNYHSSGGENSEEVLLDNSAVLTVGGNTYLNVNGGEEMLFKIKATTTATFNGDFFMNMTSGINFIVHSSEGTADFHIKGNLSFTNSGGLGLCVIGAGIGSGLLTVEGDVNLTSTSPGSMAMIAGSGKEAIVGVHGDITMSAVSENTAKITLEDEAILYFGGAFNRPTNYGLLEMTNNSLVELNGSIPQYVPPTKLSNSGTDSLFITNVKFKNTSGSPLILNGPVRVEDTLHLTNGNIITHDTAMLILEDNAIVLGGSENAYVVGPMTKLGRTNGTSFTFPVGNATKYAPIEISEVTDSDSEINTRYFGDPPPFGNTNNFETGIDDISDDGYWEINKNSKTGELDITTHWTDAQAQGINDINSLIVVGLSGTTWNNYGQESFTGGVGDGASGSITSLYSDPPPFGVINFTIGSTSNLNKLPVELTKFAAIQIDKQVGLSWQTASEVNSSHFIIERSADGFNFERIGSVDAQGNSTIGYNYFFRDKNPYQGLNYYRLKIVDNDLSFEYSFIEVVKFDKDASLIIYPNPVDKMLNIQGNNTFHGDTQLEVFDRSGQQVYFGMVDFNNGKFQISVDEINVNSAGTYFIKVTKDAENYVLKFVKIE